MMHRLLPFFLILPLTAQAIEIREFDDPAKRQRYENLIQELRCLVCQNQSLADSDADLAKDLRDEVYAIIQSGKSEQEAVKFLTDRYGDFVLYRPPFKMTTALLWIGPFLFLAGGSAFLWRQVKRRNATEDLALSDEERKRLERLRNNLEG
ncbi:cytochrome c-type biogenesis protein [Methylocaldum szegediense]|jgi:cytochrome c-type biogenesis protein CcmH|uniref:Cytochrome c-type biogenesis protein n=1 Tax=Methylocaldum szegediense TaxID=73780 RepID=A0ABM9I7Y0_9GAMM|nr:cytochrome c-type biogenesis protein [Methylocaldum szegediense]CAI8948876.1 Cytochrome c-type biogenesis protein CcmH [Methylocaldum szegediense]